ncbi:MAG TPA: OB-fold domain-containing protein [Pseudonocardiaceae bacterium]|nr:OB-fold domain-containing protein [Pseudonocardiaceae bacterium]
MTEPTPAKPLPTITDENRPFWDGCAKGELRMQECSSCGHVRYPIQSLCPRCLAAEFTWRTLSGRGEVFAQAVYHRAFHPAYTADVPYNLVLVQLAEGPRMYSNVVDGDVHVGDRLTVVFDEVADGIHLPRFRRDQED